jgi:hypothetical protein
MSGAWSYRLVRDANAKLHFAWVRFRPNESRASGVIATGIEGTDGEDMRRLAKKLLVACDQGIIGPDGEDPDCESGEDTEEESVW